MSWLVIIVISLLVSGLTSYGLAHYRGRWSVLDLPNPRSLHAAPVPRTGGLAVLLGILSAGAATFLYTGSMTLGLSLGMILAALILVAGVSLLDDVRGIGIITRLSSHLVAALLVVSAGLYINTLTIASWSFQPHTLFGIILAILFILWFINLYNFMDGMDGLAAGMGVFGFGTFALLGALAGDPGFSQFNAAIAAACLGFLLLNFPPARIFMGDVGAASLGFLAAVLTLWANHRNIFPLWVGVAVFSPFIVDATWTLVRRIMRGRKPWEAHREHVYQRLILMGWSHRKTLFWECILMAICSAAALIMVYNGRRAVEWSIWGVLAVVYVALIVAINFVESRRDTLNAA